MSNSLKINSELKSKKGEIPQKFKNKFCKYDYEQNYSRYKRRKLRNKYQEKEFDEKLKNFYENQENL